MSASNSDTPLKGWPKKNGFKGTPKGKKNKM